MLLWKEKAEEEDSKTSICKKFKIITTQRKTTFADISLGSVWAMGGRQCGKGRGWRVIPSRGWWVVHVSKRTGQDAQRVPAHTHTHIQYAIK